MTPADLVHRALVDVTDALMDVIEGQPAGDLGQLEADAIALKRKAGILLKRLAEISE